MCADCFTSTLQTFQYKTDYFQVKEYENNPKVQNQHAFKLCQLKCNELFHIKVKIALGWHPSYTPIPLDGVSATIRNFGQNDTKRGRNAKSVAETPRAQ